MTDSMRDRILGVLIAESVTCGHEWCEGGAPDDCFYCEGVYEDLANALLAAFPWLADEPTDAEVEAAARALNAEGWTCYQGRDEPGNYDECEDCRRVCAGPARTVLVAAREARTT